MMWKSLNKGVRLQNKERHYINRRTIKISEKVQQAHTEILEDFRFEHLASLLYFKMLLYVSEEDNKKAIEMIKEVAKKRID